MCAGAYARSGSNIVHGKLHGSAEKGTANSATSECARKLCMKCRKPLFFAHDVLPIIAQRCIRDTDKTHRGHGSEVEYSPASSISPPDAVAALADSSTDPTSTPQHQADRSSPSRPHRRGDHCSTCVPSLAPGCTPQRVRPRR